LQKRSHSPVTAVTEKAVGHLQPGLDDVEPSVIIISLPYGGHHSPVGSTVNG
jgi:hypothetical protein